MRPLRASGRVAVIVAVLTALTAGVAACRAAGPSRRPAPGSSARASAKPHPPSALKTRRPSVAVDPAYFSRGACMAFPPVSGNRHLTVFLDAGHGGLDPGAVGTTSTGKTVYEASETLPVVLDTMKILRHEGFRVVVSRTGATSVVRLGPGDVSGSLLTVDGAHDDIAARDVCANMAHASVLVGVYFNSGLTAVNAGCVTGYDPVRPFARSNRRLAGLVQSAVLAAMNARGWQIPDGGVRSDQGLGSALSAADAAYSHLLLLGPAKRGYFSTPSQMPGALIEPLFITDPFEATIAASERGQQVIAAGLARAVQRYFGSPHSP